MDGDQVLSPNPRRPSARKYSLALSISGLVIAAITAVLVVVWRSDDDQPAPPIAAGPPLAALAPGAAPSSEKARGGQPPPRPGTPPADAAAAMPATDAGVDADLHPHPITPRHIRIQRENNLIGELNGAMDIGDAVGLRGLLDQYRSEFPEDPNLLQEGYKIIADCLQYPGAASKAAGQGYYDRERGSILRRFVARHCQLP